MMSKLSANCITIQAARQLAGTAPSFRGNSCHVFAIWLALMGLVGTARAADVLSSVPQAPQSGDVAQNVANYFAEWFLLCEGNPSSSAFLGRLAHTVTPLLREGIRSI